MQMCIVRYDGTFTESIVSSFAATEYLSLTYIEWLALTIKQALDLTAAKLSVDLSGQE